MCQGESKMKTIPKSVFLLKEVSPLQSTLAYVNIPLPSESFFVKMYMSVRGHITCLWNSGQQCLPTKDLCAVSSKQSQERKYNLFLPHWTENYIRTPSEFKFLSFTTMNQLKLNKKCLNVQPINGDCRTREKLHYLLYENKTNFFFFFGISYLTHFCLKKKSSDSSNTRGH